MANNADMELAAVLFFALTTVIGAAGLFGAGRVRSFAAAKTGCGCGKH